MKYKINGFTLIELLIVIVIIGILASISTATYKEYLEKARLAKAQSAANQTEKYILANIEDVRGGIWTKMDSSINSLIDTSEAGNNLSFGSGVNWISDSPFGDGDSIQCTPTGSTNCLNPPSGGMLNLSELQNDPNEVMAVAFWLKIIDFPATDRDVLIPLQDNASFAISLWSNKRLEFRYDANLGSYESVFVDNLKTNRWYYVAFTHSNTRTALYLDGDLVGENLGTTYRWTPNTLTGTFYSRFGKDSSFRIHRPIISKTELPFR